jgi:hypothetical protein
MTNERDSRWRVAFGVVVLVVIADNLVLLLGRERWITKFLRSRQR